MELVEAKPRPPDRHTDRHGDQDQQPGLANADAEPGRELAQHPRRRQNGGAGAKLPNIKAVGAKARFTRRCYQTAPFVQMIDMSGSPLRARQA
jgi:hypothetical protein